MVTTGGQPTGRYFRGFGGRQATTSGSSGTVAEMIGTALRPIGHLAAWLVWHTTRVSLLSDLERPRPPHGR
jgi:hypothetical protein